MRKNCPVCLSPDRRDWWGMDFVIPDGWTLPKQNIICCCDNCGFIYYDNDATQADYDRYYSERYGYGLDGPENYARLNEVAEYVVSYFYHHAYVSDFGGGDGYLVSQLKKHGFAHAQNWNVGDVAPERCDLIVASHVLEHVYDLESVMRSFQVARYVLVEVPDAELMAENTELPLLDYHTKHVNHFGPSQMDRLFHRFGYRMAKNWHTEFMGIGCYRALYLKAPGDVWAMSRAKVTANMAAKAAKLEELTSPVIVWGCSDTTWHLLALVPDLQVAYFVDNDTKAYSPGSTIKGIPVMDKVTSGEPIVVMAQGQRALLLANIRALGLPNEIIEI